MTEATPPKRVPVKPNMEQKGIERLTELLQGSVAYMEYGAGGSTMLAGSLEVPLIISTESDAAFRVAVKEQFSRHYPGSKLVSIHADIGPTKAWGHPADDRMKKDWPLYSFGAWRHALERGTVPDLVLVDGRFRSACALASLMFARVGTPILVDDYAGRDYAASMEQVLQPSAMHGRLAEFVVPADRDWLLPIIFRALSTALTDPS